MCRFLNPQYLESLAVELYPDIGSCGFCRRCDLNFELARDSVNYLGESGVWSLLVFRTYRKIKHRHLNFANFLAPNCAVCITNSTN
jgi:hypothetical protein